MEKNWYIVIAVEPCSRTLVLDTPCKDNMTLVLYIPHKIRPRITQMQAYGKRRLGMFKCHGCIAELQCTGFTGRHQMLDSLAEVIPGTVALCYGFNVEWINGYEIERILKSCNTEW